MLNRALRINEIQDSGTGTACMKHLSISPEQGSPQLIYTACIGALTNQRAEVLVYALSSLPYEREEFNYLLLLGKAGQGEVDQLAACKNADP